MTPQRRAGDTSRRASTALGMILALAGAAVAVAMLVMRAPFTWVSLGVVLVLVFGGGALVQGVGLDRILRAWRAAGPKPPADPPGPA